MTRAILTALLLGLLAGCSDAPIASAPDLAVDAGVMDGGDVADMTAELPDIPATLDAPDAVDIRPLDAVPPTPVDPAAFLFEPVRLIPVEITLPQADWDLLRHEKRTFIDVIGPGCQDAPQVSPFNWYEADIRVDGIAVNSVGVRKKGFLGSLDPKRPSIKIKFNKFNASRDGNGDPILNGLERLTLNNGRQDPTRLRTCLAYRLFRDAGIPAPRCGFAKVSVNGVPLGVYAIVEPVKKAFLRRHFASDEGDLYEGTLSDFRPGWGATFAKKTDKEEPAGPLISDAIAACETDDATFLDALSAVIDLPAYMRFWAAEVLVGHWDGYAGNTNNFYIYQESPDALATFIPWGADATFREQYGNEAAPSSVFARAVIPARLYANPEARAAYHSTLTKLLGSAWAPVLLASVAEHWDGLIGPARLPEFHAQAAAELQVTLNFIKGQRAKIEAELAQGVQKPEPLRDGLCLTVLGSLSGSFATTFGTLAAEDLFTTGSGAFTTLDLGLAPFAGVGAKGGWDAETSGLVRIQVGTYLGEGQGGLLIDLSLLPDWIAPDSPLLLDDIAGQVRVYRWKPDGAFEDWGLLADGTLTFQAVATQAGAPIKATIEGTVLGWPQ